MAPNPGEPFPNLALMAPRLSYRLLKGVAQLDHQVGASASPGSHVPVVGGQYHRSPDPSGFPFVLYGVLVEECVRNIDHVRDAADSLRNGDVIGMNTDGGVRWQRRAKEVVRLEFPDRLPQGGEQIVAQQPSFAKGPTIRTAQPLKLVSPDFRGSSLLFQPDASRFLPGAELVTGTSVGTDDDFRPEIRGVLASKQFKRTRGHEFEVIKVGVDTKDSHGE